MAHPKKNGLSGWAVNFQATAEFDSGDAQDPVRAQRIYDAVTFSVQPWPFLLSILYVFSTDSLRIRCEISCFWVLFCVTNSLNLLSLALEMPWGGCSARNTPKQCMILRHLMIVQKQILNDPHPLSLHRLFGMNSGCGSHCLHRQPRSCSRRLNELHCGPRAVPKSQSAGNLTQETFRFSMFLGWIHCEFTFHLMWCPFAQIWSPFLHLWHVRNAGYSLDILVSWYSRLYALEDQDRRVIRVGSF